MTRSKDDSKADTARRGGRSSGDPESARVVQKREFVERVVQAAGTQKSVARPIIDAVLDQLGQAIAAGETLAIPPFGKARVTRQTDVRGAEIITLRLRRKGAGGPGGDATAAGDDD